MQVRGNPLIPVAGLWCSMFAMYLLYLASALPFISLATAWTTYVVPYASGNDDTPALTAAFSKNSALSADATIVFRKGVTYNILTPLVFPSLQNVIVSIQGNISYAADIKKTQGQNPKPFATNFPVLMSGIHSYQQLLRPQWVAPPISAIYMC